MENELKGAVGIEVSDTTALLVCSPFVLVSLWLYGYWLYQLYMFDKEMKEYWAAMNAASNEKGNEDVG